MNEEREPPKSSKPSSSKIQNPTSKICAIGARCEAFIIQNPKFKIQNRVPARPPAAQPPQAVFKIQNLKSKIKNPTFIFCAIGALLLFLLDASIRYWRNSVPVSDAPVFSLPMADEAMSNQEELPKFARYYKADRGVQMDLDGPNGEEITLFYLEWDATRIGPVSAIAGHQPEICNEAVGFKLIEVAEPRFFDSPDHSPLQFDSTRFSSPSGDTVYIFKAAWFQGIGSWDIRLTENRFARTKASFKLGEGSGRVIEAGVSGAEGSDEAWSLFEQQVLRNITWSE